MATHAPPLAAAAAAQPLSARCGQQPLLAATAWPGSAGATRAACAAQRKAATTPRPRPAPWPWLEAARRAAGEPAAAPSLSPAPLGAAPSSLRLAPLQARPLALRRLPPPVCRRLAASRSSLPTDSTAAAHSRGAAPSSAIRAGHRAAQCAAAALARTPARLTESSAICAPPILSPALRDSMRSVHGQGVAGPRRAALPLADGAAIVQLAAQGGGNCCPLPHLPCRPSRDHSREAATHDASLPAETGRHAAPFRPLTSAPQRHASHGCLLPMPCSCAVGSRREPETHGAHARRRKFSVIRWSVPLASPCRACCAPLAAHIRPSQPQTMVAIPWELLA